MLTLLDERPSEWWDWKTTSRRVSFIEDMVPDLSPCDTADGSGPGGSLAYMESILSWLGNVKQIMLEGEAISANCDAVLLSRAPLYVTAESVVGFHAPSIRTLVPYSCVEARYLEVRHAMTILSGLQVAIIRQRLGLPTFVFQGYGPISTMNREPLVVTLSEMAYIKPWLESRYVDLSRSTREYDKIYKSSKSWWAATSDSYAQYLRDRAALASHTGSMSMCAGWFIVSPHQSAVSTPMTGGPDPTFAGYHMPAPGGPAELPGS